MHRILLVDDAPGVLDKLAEALELHGKTVTTATNGTDALAILAKSPGDFDVVLLDMRMPGPDGNYVLEHSPAKPPFIIHTGMMEDVTVRQEFIGTKVLGVLKKPYDVAELLEALERVPCGVNA